MLNNPVYNALISRDRHLSSGTEQARFFEESVSPFAGFEETNKNGFDELFALLLTGRLILYATPQHIPTPHGWQLLHKAQGLQMVFSGKPNPLQSAVKPTVLQKEHVEAMMALTKLTKPGPFSSRTIDFGNYFGIFEERKLVAMAGQRLHVEKFTEISAVCTHPDALSKGYASLLVQHQVNLICEQGKIPFLHVRKDNLRAVTLYQRLGFSIRCPMNFYFMRRRSRKRAQ